MNKKVPLLLTGIVLMLNLAADTSGSPYGICAHICKGEQWKLAEPKFKVLKPAGIRWVRNGFTWAQAEPEQGRWDYSKLDLVAETAKKHGVDILPILAYDVPWGHPVYRHLDKWREYVRRTVSRYGKQFRYWEIWNEPDLRTDDEPAENKPTWGGTKAEFFDFFETAAKYLKGKFPQLKIGGPAVAFRTDWAEDFLSEMAKRNVPLDFFSWHGYRTQPGDFTELGRFYRALLDKYGYTNAENHVNEWNYIRDWTENFVYSIETIGGCKGAAFDMAAISAAQESPIDTMMYYDTRPSSFCGLFDYYTYRPKKPYYVFYWYGSFYDCAHFIPCQSRIPDIFTLCGMYADGKTQAVLTYYTDKDGQPAKTVTVDLGRTAKWDVYLLDETHNAERIETTQCPTFTLQPNTCMLLKEVD